MVRMWYISGAREGEPVTLDTLKTSTGVFCCLLDPKKCREDGSLNKLKEERGYTFEDEIDISPHKLENYKQQIEAFHQEHLHSEEESHLVLDGIAYFDVRDRSDAWIRIEITPGDWITLPAGIYHRLTLKEKNCVKMLRFFEWKPVWDLYNRQDGADDLDARHRYMESAVNDAEPSNSDF